MSYNDFFTMIEKHKLISVEGENAVKLTFDLTIKRMIDQIKEYGKAENKLMVFFYSLFTGETSPQKIGTHLTAHFGISLTGRIGDFHGRLRKVKVKKEVYPF